MLRARFGLIAVFAITSAIAVPAGSQPPGTAALVEDLLGPRLGLAMDEWKAHAPQASWHRYRTESDRLSAQPPAGQEIWPAGLWCAVATSRLPRIERVAVFFAIRSSSPLACRLELVQQVVRGTREETAALYTALIDALSARLGDGLSVDFGRNLNVPFPWGGATGYPQGVRWREARSWAMRDADVFIFLADGAVGVSLRSHVARNAEEEGRPFDADPLIRAELAAALHARYPAAAIAVGIESEVSHQPEIRAGLVQVLQARARATGSDRALVSLAADWLARQLWIEGAPPRQRTELAPILRFGLRFTYDAHSSLWQYDGALARQVIREFPDDRWGELAFVARLQAGWIEECSGQEYRAVIRQGLSWLPRHPRSPWRIPVMTALAQAYETQWTGADFFTADPAQNARLTDAASEGARQQAIQWYERIIRLAPYSQDAAYARRRIVQIKLNMNTGQEKFSCFIP